MLILSPIQEHLAHGGPALILPAHSAAGGMPHRPVPISRCWQEVETPDKLPRPLKRQEQGCPHESLKRGQELPLSAPFPAEDHRSCKGTLCDVALVESLALLKVSDMLPAAAACVAWRRLVDSTELWHIASPRLRVMDRIVWKSKICERRSRGSMRSGILLGTRKQEVAVRCVNLRHMNASCDDGLVPSVVREVAFLQSLARMRHSSFVRLLEVEVTGDWVHIVMTKMARSFQFWASCSPTLPEIRDFFKQLLEAVAFLHARAWGLCDWKGAPSNCRPIVDAMATSRLPLLFAGVALAQSDTDGHLRHKVGKSSQVEMALLLLLSAVLVFGIFLYQRFVRDRDRVAEEDLERIKTTDKCLKAILKNFSIQKLEENRFRGITKKLQTASLEFNSISCSVLAGSEQRPILDEISGKFEAYHLSAVMGPSGCGKSTLLDVLTGKKKTDSKWTVKGDILINNQKIDIETIKPIIGFVPQDDVVHEGLTVRENIFFSAAKRMPAHTSRSRLRAITNDVLQVLQLEPKQNLLVGNRTRTGEGLSGGQKKRVNVGIELAACPTILFLDEPTSGLDATASLLLVQQLKRMARLGVTIVMVIHQPRYDLFTLLDDVLLLGTLEKMGGRLAYMGPTVQAKEHFQALGLDMPANWNPADWMMDILSGQNLDQSNCRIPISEIPAALFQRWNELPVPQGKVTFRRGMSAYDKADNDEEFQMIHQHCKDAWSAVAPPHVRLEADGFAQVLKSCLGAIPEPDIVSGIMKRASAYETRHNSSLYLNDESSGQPYITMRAFSNYLVSFRGLTLKDDARRRGPGDSTDTDTGDSSSSGSEDSVDEERCGICPGLLRDKSKPLLADGLRRTQPGFCGHLNCTVQTSLISFWRTMGIKMLFLVVMIFAAGFLGVMDVVVFKTPRWSPTGFLNVQIALALLVSVYSLQLFSLDQEMYWREASHGLNRASFFLGRTLVQTLDWALLTFVYVSMYYCIEEFCELPPLLTGREVQAFLEPFGFLANTPLDWQKGPLPELRIIIAGHSSSGRHLFYNVECTLWRASHAGAGYAHKTEDASLTAQPWLAWRASRRLAHLRQGLHDLVKSHLGSSYKTYFCHVPFAQRFRLVPPIVAANALRVLGAPNLKDSELPGVDFFDLSISENTEIPEEGAESLTTRSSDNLPSSSPSATPESAMLSPVQVEAPRRRQVDRVSDIQLPGLEDSDSASLPDGLTPGELGTLH
ncbi:ABCG24 [Symbiodinium necroappetens]|uniref:ABCG24 protein n=1 Tax=Symbiodinium necroappetens TaxID=1628268 RepID=A0A812Z0J0_9DINO|nr:ABCG24 [Symbiodinium necroappetens]